MTRDSLLAAIERCDAFAEKQHRLLRSLVEQFSALVVAIEPVMRACPDAAVLLRFYAEIRRINRTVDALVARGDLH